MTKTPISVTIITLNEAGNIADCIASVADVADEVIVVDSNSTDETCAIAEAAGARIFRQDFLGDGPQKNHAASLARNDWILCLDADERATPELVALVSGLDLQAGACGGYTVRRRNFIGSRWVRYGGWYPDRITRLYDRSRMSFTTTVGHSQVVGGSVEALDADILHYSYVDCAHVLAGGRYAARDAYQLYRAGHRSGLLKAVSRSTWAFLWAYFGRGGMFGGTDGFTVCVSVFLRAYRKYTILEEMHRDPQVRAHYDAIFAEKFAQAPAKAGGE